MAEFEIGQKVRITRKITPNERMAWGYSWLDEMDGMVGQVGEVVNVYGSGNLSLVMYNQKQHLQYVFPAYLLTPAFVGASPAIEALLHDKQTAQYAAVLGANGLAHAEC